MPSEDQKGRRIAMTTILGLAAFALLLLPLLAATWLVPPTERTLSVLDLRDGEAAITAEELERIENTVGAGASTLVTLVAPDEELPECNRLKNPPICLVWQKFSPALSVSSDIKPAQLMEVLGADPNDVSRSGDIYSATVRDQAAGRWAVAVIVAAVLAAGCAMVLHAWSSPHAYSKRSRRWPAGAKAATGPAAPPPKRTSPTSPPVPAGAMSGRAATLATHRRRSPTTRGGGSPGSTRPGTTTETAAPAGGTIQQMQPLSNPSVRPATAGSIPPGAPGVRPAGSGPRACTFVDVDGGYVEFDNVIRWAKLAGPQTATIEPDEPVSVVDPPGEPLLVVLGSAGRPTVTGTPSELTYPERKS